ncbi:MAG TPA: serine hydrolase [Methylomirabilota bacterium]|nr:serine hydrolase [Methylomirabilota bacterium]
MRDLQLCLLAILAVLPAPLSAQTTASDQRVPLRKPDSSTIQALEQRLPELMKQANIPGVSIALIRDGKTYWLHEFGVRNTKTNAPVTADTIFEAASLSKPVFAYGVLKLVDQGKLELDVPLSKYLPKPYIEGDLRLDKITARIVLSHRTGFRNWRPGNSLEIYFTPGERFSYSGEGFVYLQKVVEQITGKPLNDYMTEAVFTPLGMTGSSYVWRDNYDSLTANGHDPDGQPGEKYKPKDSNAASSLHTTARDYATFLDALLNGKGLKPTTLREMEKPQIAVDPECTNCTDRLPKELSKSVFWGLGIGIQETAQGESLWHWGDNGAFKGYTVVYPKQKIGVVYFANSENGLSIAGEVVRTAVGGEQPALRWVKYDSYNSPAMQFAKAVREQGAPAAISQFRPALVRGDISEDSINSSGYRLLSQKKIADAILIFQLNVELYPKSSNAYDSLGEAYMNNNEKDLAIQNYQKSLELNPKNQNAVDMLKKIQQP